MTTNDKTTMKRLLGIAALIFIVIAMASGGNRTEQEAPASTAPIVAAIATPKAGDRAAIDSLTAHACLKTVHLTNPHLWPIYCDIFFKDTEVIIKEWPPYGWTACVTWHAGPAPHWEKRTSQEPSDCLWTPKHFLKVIR